MKQWFTVRGEKGDFFKEVSIMGFTYSFTFNFLILLLVCLAVSAVGFYKYVYFISLGYGFSVAAQGLSMLFLYRKGLAFGTALQCILLIVYGCRLGGYLLLREKNSAAYQRNMKKEIKDGSGMKKLTKVAIWVSCALLYVLQVSPVYFRLENGFGSDGFSMLGTAIMIAGIALESVADLQKSRAKEFNPNRFCDTGLYKIVRCPNYLGEIVFWTGMFVSSLNIYDGIWEWGAALIGYVCIVYIMFGGARRLEIRQNRNYGADPEYRRYVKKTPIILPLVPLYSVEKYKWLVG